MSWTLALPFIISTLKIVLAQVDPSTPAGRLAALALLILNQLSPSSLATHSPDHKFGITMPPDMPPEPYNEANLRKWAEDKEKAEHPKPTAGATTYADTPAGHAAKAEAARREAPKGDEQPKPGEQPKPEASKPTTNAPKADDYRGASTKSDDQPKPADHAANPTSNAAAAPGLTATPGAAARPADQATHADAPAVTSPHTV